jgi:hypothetical protein
MCTYAFPYVHTQFLSPVQDRKYYANPRLYNMVRVARIKCSSDIAHTNSDTKLKRAICYCLCHVLHITIDCNFKLQNVWCRIFTIASLLDDMISFACDRTSRQLTTTLQVVTDSCGDLRFVLRELAYCIEDDRGSFQPTG